MSEVERVRVVPNIEKVAGRTKTGDQKRWRSMFVIAPVLIVWCPMVALILFSVKLNIAFLFKVATWVALVFLTFVSALWARDKEQKLDDWILETYLKKVKEPLEENPEDFNTKCIEFTADYSTLYSSTFEGSMTPVSVLWVLYLIIGSLYTLKWYIVLIMVVIEIAMIVLNVKVYSDKFKKTIPKNPEA